MILSGIANTGVERPFMAAHMLGHPLNKTGSAVYLARSMTLLPLFLVDSCVWLCAVHRATASSLYRQEFHVFNLLSTVDGLQFSSLAIARSIPASLVAVSLLALLLGDIVPSCVLA